MNPTLWSRLRWSLYAPFYDLVAANPVFRLGRRRSIAMAQLGPGECVLLVAAGTGIDLELLPAGIGIVVIDWAPAMLERLKARAAQRMP